MKRYKYYSKLFALFVLTSLALNSVNFSHYAGRNGNHSEARIQRSNESGGLDVGKAD